MAVVEFDCDRRPFSCWVLLTSPFSIFYMQLRMFVSDRNARRRVIVSGSSVRRSWMLVDRLCFILALLNCGH